MFKSWKKKYEEAYKLIELSRNMYRDQAHRLKLNDDAGSIHLCEIYTAQAIALSDTLKDMDRIRES